MLKKKIEHLRPKQTRRQFIGAAALAAPLAVSFACADLSVPLWKGIRYNKRYLLFSVAKPCGTQGETIDITEGI